MLEAIKVLPNGGVCVCSSDLRYSMSSQIQSDSVIFLPVLKPTVVRKYVVPCNCSEQHSLVLMVVSKPECGCSDFFLLFFFCDLRYASI